MGSFSKRSFSGLSFQLGQSINDYYYNNPKFRKNNNKPRAKK